MDKTKQVSWVSWRSNFYVLLLCFVAFLLYGYHNYHKLVEHNLHAAQNNLNLKLDKDSSRISSLLGYMRYSLFTELGKTLELQATQSLGALKNRYALLLQDDGIVSVHQKAAEQIRRMSRIEHVDYFLFDENFVLLAASRENPSLLIDITHSAKEQKETLKKQGFYLLDEPTGKHIWQINLIKDFGFYLVHYIDINDFKEKFKQDIFLRVKNLLISSRYVIFDKDLKIELIKPGDSEYEGFYDNVKNKLELIKSNEASLFSLSRKDGLTEYASLYYSDFWDLFFGTYTDSKEFALSIKDGLDEIKSDNTNQALGALALALLVLGFFSLSSRRAALAVKVALDKFIKTLKNSLDVSLPIPLENIEYKEFKEMAKQVNSVIHELSLKNNTESVTGLANRYAFREKVKELALVPGYKIVISKIILNNFKWILRNSGYLAAEGVLKELANRLLTFGGEKVIIGKISGGSFLYAICIASNDAKEIESISQSFADRVNAALTKGIYLEDKSTYSQQIHIGSALVEDDLEAAFESAYKAALSIKNTGKHFVFYTPQIGAESNEHKNLEQALIEALEKRELSVFYQPKIDLFTEQICGAEALVRWIKDDKFVNPELFIHVAEQSTLINKVGDYVIDQVCLDQKAWAAEGIFIKVSINISSRQLDDPDFLVNLQMKLKKHGIKNSQIDLELTERLGASQQNYRVLVQARALGLSISIDDFGKDYSSLSCLKDLPVDVIKIDKVFIDDIAFSQDTKSVKDKKGHAMVKGIIQISKDLHNKTVAEGVETSFQRDILKKLSCDEAQGWYYSKAVPGEIFATFLKASLFEGKKIIDSKIV